MREELAHALAISSMPMQMVTDDPEMPPYCSGNGIPRMPFSAKSFSMSLGYSAVWSISAARGATRSCTSSRIVSRIAICSSENSKSTGVSLAEQLSGDDHSLDLVRALVDLQRFRIAYVSLERTAGSRTGLPSDLERVERQLHRGVGAVELGHRGLAGERPAAAAQPRRVVREQPRRLETCRHVGQEEVVALFVAFPHELSRLVHRRLRDAERLARDA